ncbi:hypothetical protein THAOC_15277 [Thalassiosira oceanica]|uniref:Uncharacterized protein n=1 Tax=Thalassiosira oceanica TaxID=159749 RepID=K0SD37_THAOC|nr:hypothetical protein THAOC_15277 [Thalassiosira oceanica]|eukprot:EJK64033.1 hypothetical protein THAOC_15277 [Thalassiosira oceanica]
MMPPPTNFVQEVMMSPTNFGLEVSTMWRRTMMTIVNWSLRAGGRSERETRGKLLSQRESRSSSRSTYQSNVEFFDLDDDEDNDFFDDDDDDFEDALLDDTTYNGIIPNPLLDSIDPDGVYERLGPELFSDWTFWRDLILFAAFMTLFDNDTHLYGRFDSVIEGLERLPPDFIPMP